LESGVTSHEQRTANQGAEQTAQHSAQPLHSSGQAGMAVPLEPPPWLAAQMKDPWAGEEAREFWNGVQQARTEAAAYRAAIASPEDAQALKELYPGGVSEARSAAQRARLLDDIDRAYFGSAGTTPEQSSASRAQLAQRMLREDPAAFREMVVAGLRALDEAEKGSGASLSNVTPLPRLAQVLATQSAQPSDVPATQGFTSAQSTPAATALTPKGMSYSNGIGAAEADREALLASYASFEKAANEELERSVGGAIERTLQQALPVMGSSSATGQAGAQRNAPIRERLTASVRTEIEKALRGDRQLGEQVARVLSSRNFNNDARAQVVRLIAERAQHLVPGAAKRVLNEWTQTTLAAHRSRTQRTASAAVRNDLTPAENGATIPRPQAAKSTQPSARNDNGRGRPSSVNYRKLSDEQILDMS
jgi:hypothetical protein